MRNLIPVHRACIRTSEQCPNKLSHISITEDGNPLFVFTDGQEGDFVSVCEKIGTAWNWWPSWPGAKISSVLPGEPAIFILCNGNIVESSAQGAEIVGGLDVPILASGWSPDGEVGVLVTKDKVLFLSRSLDPIGDHSFQSSDLELSKHVSVGWGKKETQFKGRGARAARDPTMPEKVDTGVLALGDSDEIVNVSWRGDGEFVAVSGIQDNRRVIRIFSREGTLSSVTEPLDHLLPLVAWRPSGAVIASIQQNYGVVFFERNGLRRYGFELKRPSKVRGLGWSYDSEILAVQFEDCVELWTTKNYHWYRKQVIVSNTGQTNTDFIYWHPEKRTLLVGWGGDVVETHSFTTGIFGGPTSGPQDDGTVAVIDGDKIKMTPLAKFNFPPPMSKFALACTNANYVAVSPFVSSQGPSSIVVTTPTGFQLLPEDKHIKVEGTPRQAVFTMDGRVVTLSDVNSKSSLCIDGIEQPTQQGIYLLRPGHYQTNDGSIYDYKHAFVAKFERVCADFQVVNGLAFGLTEQGTLFVWDHHHECRVLARGITSMLLSDRHLLVTTPTLLKFIHLDQPQYPEDAQTEQCREIERGSLLVTVVPAKMLVVLQAPRGNLETIYPRMLVLNEVRKQLDACDYKSAFASCRIHRIDLQYLYDHNPALFEDNIAKFVDIGEDYLDLFLSSLKPENVAETKYKETSGQQSIEPQPPKDVNAVCDLMLGHLTGRNIVTAHACKQDLETALRACQGEKEIQHLIYLTDAEVLYRTALAMYDLKLTLVVAQQAQKDPKEYLAFLRARDKESEYRRRFNIDELLKNRALAATHLVQDKEATDAEIVEYVERYELYTTVLPLLEGERENAVLESYAHYLQTKGEYQQAGLNFEYLGLKQEALESYSRCGDWRRAVSLDPSCLQDLADSCIALKKYADAAEMFNYHLHKPALAIEYYSLAFRFDDAILVDPQSPLIDQHLREQFGVIQELLSDCRNQIPSQLRRLRELRTKRQQEQGFTIDGLAHEFDDAMSIAGTETTNASFMTRYTDKTGGTAQTGMSRKTQKNRRREERKKARGKKGTVYEEEYLIASMGRLMERVEATRPDAQRLADALVRRQMRSYALQIKQSYGQVLELITEHVTEFYTVDENDLIRYDQNGEKYMAPAPVPPKVPALLS